MEQHCAPALFLFLKDVFSNYCFIDEEQLRIDSDFQVLINCEEVRDDQRHQIIPDSPPGYPLIGIRIEICSVPIGTSQKCKDYANG